MGDHASVSNFQGQIFSVRFSVSKHPAQPQAVRNPLMCQALRQPYGGSSFLPPCIRLDGLDDR
jgi:hypothetical protein